MPEISFAVDSCSVGTIRFEPQSFRGEGGIDWPRLVGAIEIGVKPRDVEVEHPNQKGQRVAAIQHYSILGLRAQLSVGHSNAQNLIAESSYEAVVYESHEWLNQHQSVFPLDMHRISRIEAQRSGDASFRIRFHLTLLKHGLVLPKNRAAGFDSFQTVTCDQYLVIPKSQWIERVLPGLGYGKYKVVEIPIPSAMMREPFLEAIASFEKAQGYFVSEDFDKAVAHCRDVLELIPHKFKPEEAVAEGTKFNERVRAAVKEQFGKKLSDSKINYVCDLIKAHWNLTSRTHHAGVAIDPYFTG